MKFILNKKYILFLLFFFVVVVSVSAATVTTVFDSKFFNRVKKISSVNRSHFLADYKDSFVSANGYVFDVVEHNNYKKNYRIVLQEQDAGTLSVIYYIYTNESDYKKLLNKGDIFDFKGQLVLVTPLNSKRDAYIFDIILEDGSIVVD